MLNTKKNTFISGGKDGQIITWDQNYNKLITLDLKPMTNFDPGVRAIDMSASGNLIIGSKGAEVVLKIFIS